MEWPNISPLGRIPPAELLARGALSVLNMNWEGLAEMVQAAAALQATVREPRWRSEDRVWRTEDREWRHEDRGWRKADLSWRQEEQEFMCAPCRPTWRIRT